MRSVVVGRKLWWALCAVWLSACGEHGAAEPAPSASSAAPASVPAESRATSASVAVNEVGSEAWRSLSARQRADRIQVLQASAGPEFAITEATPGVLSARQPAMELSAAFRRGGVSVVVGNEGEGSASVPAELAASAWGCAGTMKEVADTSPASDATRPGVSYQHPDFNEWYSIGPAGLEQGFTVHALPECVKRGAKLQIQLRFEDVKGSLVRVNDGGTEAVLTTPGRHSLHYSDPFGEDAKGTELAIKILGGDSLSLEIDTTNAVLPLVIDPLVWQSRQKILSSDFVPSGFSANDFFGRSVAVSGDTALIGSYGDNDKGADAGAAYVYIRVPYAKPGVGLRWGPQQKLTANDAAAGHFFGSSVALSGNTALIGAYADADKGLGAGAAYVFVRNGTTWTQQQKLTPADLTAGDKLGYAVALAADTAVVGAPFQTSSGVSEVGAAYIFTRAGSVWTQQTKISPPSGTFQVNHFAAALALSGDNLAIGRDNTAAGGVDWFARTGTTWNGTGSLTSPIAHFGSALAMNDTTTVIGAYGDTLKGTDSGSVTLATAAAPHTKGLTLTASNAAANAEFGYAVAISGTNIFVGAPKAGAVDTGAAYIFGLVGNSWNQQNLLAGTSGFALAAAANLLLIGAPFGSDFAANMGRVWDYEYGLNNASPCTQTSDCLGGYCVEGVCCESECTGPCSSCLAALKDKTSYCNTFHGIMKWQEGMCGSITEDTDPKDACPSSGTFCGASGMCDACANCKGANPQGTPCGGSSPTCATPTSTAAASVCLSYVCAPVPSACAVGYSCSAGVCKTSCTADTDCDTAKGFSCIAGSCKLSAGATCAADSDCATGSCGFGVCCTPIPPYGCSTPPGALCATDDECFTHNCVDGVCCASACKGPCESCAVVGSEGICTPVTNDPGDAPGLCSPQGGGGNGGGGAGGGGNGGGGAGGTTSNGTSGGGTDSGGGGAEQAGGGATQVGGAGTSGGGTGGMSAEAGDTAVVAGASGAHDGVIECVPACAAGSVCDQKRGICQDELVRACGCRAAGGRGAPLPPLSLLGLFAVGWSVRRKRRTKTVLAKHSQQ